MGIKLHYKFHSKSLNTLSISEYRHEIVYTVIRIFLNLINCTSLPVYVHPWHLTNIAPLLTNIDLLYSPSSLPLLLSSSSSDFLGAEICLPTNCSHMTPVASIGLNLFYAKFLHRLHLPPHAFCVATSTVNIIHFHDSLTDLAHFFFHLVPPNMGLTHLASLNSVYLTSVTNMGLTHLAS